MSEIYYRCWLVSQRVIVSINLAETKGFKEKEKKHKYFIYSIVRVSGRIMLSPLCARSQNQAVRMNLMDTILDTEFHTVQISQQKLIADIVIDLTVRCIVRC